MKEGSVAEQQRSAADTRYALGNVNHLQFDFKEAGRHFRAAIRKYRALRDAGNPEVEPDLAKVLVYIGITYTELDRPEEALRADQVAARLYRKLAEKRPDAFLPDLAMSLNNLGADLSGLGQREAAMKATQEAIDIRKVLAMKLPAVFEAELKKSQALLDLIKRQGNSLKAEAGSPAAKGAP